MANEKQFRDPTKMIRLIDANALIDDWNKAIKRMVRDSDGKTPVDFGLVIREVSKAPTVGAYTAHEVAEIIADLFGDTCACNFNRIDEWLPEKCELLDACPNTVGVACWEQWLKYRCAKMDGDGNA